MSRLTSRSVASIVVTAALLAAGCGSSSKSNTTPAPATPATPSTASTGTGTSTTSAQVTPATQITSPAFKALLAREAAKNGAPTSKASAFADCWVTKLQAAGIKTAGDFKSNTSKAKAAVEACNKQVGVKVKP